MYYNYNYFYLQHLLARNVTKYSHKSSHMLHYSYNICNNLIPTSTLSNFYLIRGNTVYLKLWMESGTWSETTRLYEALFDIIIVAVSQSTSPA